MRHCSRCSAGLSRNGHFCVMCFDEINCLWKCTERCPPPPPSPTTNTHTHTLAPQSPFVSQTYDALLSVTRIMNFTIIAARPGCGELDIFVSRVLTKLIVYGTPLSAGHHPNPCCFQYKRCLICQLRHSRKLLLGTLWNHIVMIVC